MTIQDYCKRCRAPIYRLKHITTGNLAAIDAKPSLAGNCELDLDLGVYRSVPLLDRGGKALHVNHYATCPFASEFKGDGKGGQDTREAVPPLPATKSVGSRARELVLYVPVGALEQIAGDQRRSDALVESGEARSEDVPAVMATLKIRVVLCESSEQPASRAVDQMEAAVPVVVRPHDVPSFRGSDGVLGECLRLLLLRYMVSSAPGRAVPEGKVMAGGRK